MEPAHSGPRYKTRHIILMKPIHLLSVFALVIGAWQFLPRHEPGKNLNTTEKSLPKNAPLWQHAARAVQDEAATLKMPEVKLPQIELPEIVVEEWPGSVAVKKTAKVHFRCATFALRDHALRSGQS